MTFEAMESDYDREEPYNGTPRPPPGPEPKHLRPPSTQSARSLHIPRQDTFGSVSMPPTSPSTHRRSITTGSQSSPPQPETGSYPPITRTTHFPPYLPSLLPTLTTTSHLPAEPQVHFANLGCSLLTHPTAAAPTLEQLKQHTQALCLLISLLQPQADINSNAGPFDFLHDLERPYTNNSEEHHVPLTSLGNTLPSIRADRYNRANPNNQTDSNSIGDLITQLPCPLLHSPDTNTVVDHASALLGRLDHIFAPTGGLLSIPLPLPSSPSPPPSPSSSPSSTSAPPPAPNLLSQWLTYTTHLPLRLAHLERSLASLSELLANEAMVPAVRLSQSSLFTATTTGGIRELVAAQDRYVLAGLTPALWERLADEFDVADGYARTRETWARTHGLTTPAGIGADVDAGNNNALSHGSCGDAAEGDDGGEEREVVTWIETSARLYRHSGRPQTVFVVPAWDVKPGAEAVREIESRPLVVAVGTRDDGGM